MMSRSTRFFLVAPILLLCGILWSTPQLSAQGDDPQSDTSEFDDFNFDDIPVDDYRELDYVGFGLGYLGNYGLLPFDEINALGAQFGMPEMSPGLLSHRLGVFIGGIGLKNIRYGFYFPISGSKAVTSTVKLPGSNDDYERKLVFSSNRFTFQLDYAIFLPQEGLVLFPGLMVSREKSEVELFQIRAKDLTYQTLFNPDEYNGTVSAEAARNRYARIERNTFQLQPTVTLDFAVNYFLLLRAGVGYGFNITDDWQHASGTSITEVPGINSDGVQIQFGLFIGLFQK